MNDKTLVSELEYFMELDLVDLTEALSLIRRSIKELKSLNKTVDVLDKTLSNLRWKDAICTGSY